MPGHIVSILVDDEPAARRKLRRMLGDYEQVMVAGEADDIASAVLLIRSEKPDVVFLDIRMSGENGFDLLNELPFSVNVVFVTAFDDYALDAFEANALDYLVKPIHPDRLRQCIEKVGKYLSAPERGNRSEPLLLKNASGRIQRVPVEQICCITAQGDYTLLKSPNGEFLVRRTIKDWMNRLPDDRFTRVSRSLVMNLKTVRRLSPRSDRFEVLLDGLDDALSVSHTEGMRLRRLL